MELPDDKMELLNGKMELLDEKMELPDDVLQIIKQYSKPATRPDWRTIHKMTDDELYRRLLPFTILRGKTDTCVIHVMTIKRIVFKLYVYEKLKMDIEIIQNI